tara:strand:- start:113 stop:940 length:828 start_codon:yes stop_codon:yes gene_type:complete
MKNKHNKKRNTAFIFEALLREMSKAIIEKDKTRKKKIFDVLQEHFSKGTILEQELQCYRALIKESSLDSYTAEKMIHRAKTKYDNLNKKKIFQEQSKVISKINKTIAPSVFSNYVPNYKSFATIAQIFSEKTPLKQKVLMERQIVGVLTSSPEEKTKETSQVNSLVVNNFTEKFNNRYSELLPEQQRILGRYVSSFDDDGADFRIVVGSELRRIHAAVKESLSLPEIMEDEQMKNNTEKVLGEIESFNVSNITEKDLKKILKLQHLVSEYETDDS